MYNRWFRDYRQEELSDVLKNIEPRITESFEDGRKHFCFEMYNRIWFTGKRLKMDLSSRQVMTLLRMTLKYEFSDEVLDRQEGKSTLLMSHILFNLSEYVHQQYMWIGLSQHNLAYVRDTFKRYMNKIREEADDKDDTHWLETKRENKDIFLFDKTNNMIRFSTQGVLHSCLRGFRPAIIYIDECQKDIVDKVRDLMPMTRIIALRTDFDEEWNITDMRPHFVNEKTWEHFKERQRQITPKSK